MSENLLQLPADLPVPENDGAADHLPGLTVPPVGLMATDGTTVGLSSLAGIVVVYAYPMTGRPGRELPPGWDDIPGARGCTAETCSFRDHHTQLLEAGASAVFGLSTQSHGEQREMVERLHVPYPVLSDMNLEFTAAMRLPTFSVEGRTLLRRLTMVLQNGRVDTVFYPVFPPDEHPAEVLAHLQSRTSGQSV